MSPSRTGAAAFALLLPVLLSCTTQTGATAAVCASRAGLELTGTWAVVGYADGTSPTVSANGQRDHEPKGAPDDGRALGDSIPALRPARGFVVYDDAGYVHGQILYGPNAPAQRAWEEATREQLLELLGHQNSFYGTFEVDSAARRVIHRLEREMPPGPGHYEQVLPFVMRGDTLYLGDASRRRWRLLRQHPGNGHLARRACDPAA